MVQAGSVLGFGAFGLAVAAGRFEAGEAVVVESPGGQLVFCAGCGGRARSKGRHPVVLRDAPLAGGIPVGVLWNKRIWACPNRECATGSWAEQSGLAGARRVLTGGAVDCAVGALGAAGAAVAGLGRKLGVGWHTVWSAALPALRQAADDPGRVVAAARVGFDETVMAPATRRRRRRFVSAAVDAGAGQIMGVFDGRGACGLERWAQRQPEELMAAVEVACLDPHAGCRKAIRALKAKGVLGQQARAAADPFHIVRLANRALDDCRRRTQNDATGHRGRKGGPLYGARSRRRTGRSSKGHRGRKGGPLYGARKLLLMGAERLDPRGWEKKREALDEGDPCDEAADCWAAEEKTRSVFKADDSDQASDLLDDAIEYCAAPEAAPELHKLARTLNKWRTEINTSPSTGAHNGRTEAANANTKDIKRSARGFQNQDNYRPRILLATGQQPGQTQPATKTRTRHPRSDA